MAFTKRKSVEPPKRVEAVKKVEPPKKVEAPKPKKPEPPVCANEHVELVAAAILGGMLGSTCNTQDLTQLRPFVEQSVHIALEVIEVNRSKAAA
jgi:hypothetical protein